MNKILQVFIIYFLCISSSFAEDQTNCNLGSSFENQTDKTATEKYVEEQLKLICNLSELINEQEEFDELANLGLHNDRGLAYFFIGEFENALEDFNFIFTIWQDDPSTAKSYIGTALCGRMLSHVFMGDAQGNDNDALILEAYFKNCSSYENEPTEGLLQSKSKFLDFHSARFAEPDEKITRRECFDRTQAIADKARAIVDCLDSILVRKGILIILDKLEKKTYSCCNAGNHWTICLGPIADVWQKLEEISDQIVDLYNRGVNLQLLLVGPHNL